MTCVRCSKSMIAWLFVFDMLMRTKVPCFPLQSGAYSTEIDMTPHCSKSSLVLLKVLRSSYFRLSTFLKGIFRLRLGKLRERLQEIKNVENNAYPFEGDD
ncbi:hypothetical protein SETIT_4G076500v2 [Setaria italica]|uniref:Uncharacterized protein n=1 Tax=Setaria italica TaxID=4555 RepID=A0A368QS78_SETIT|nr:hypothetical protein SETIT_4G076500v2 [Setaria italica]